MYYHHHLETPHILFHHTVSGEATPDFALHCHAEYEIYFYIRGDVSYLVEGQAYPGAAQHAFAGPGHLSRGAD